MLFYIGCCLKFSHTHTHTHIQVFALKGQSDPDLHSFLRVGHGYPTIQVNSVYNEKKNQKKKPLSGISLIMTGKKWIVLRPTEVIHVQRKVMFLSVAISLQLSFIVSIFSICSPLLQLTVWSYRYTSFKKGMFDIPLWREWPTISIMKRMASNIRWNCLLSTVI